MFYVNKTDFDGEILVNIDFFWEFKESVTI